MPTVQASSGKSLIGSSAEVDAPPKKRSPVWIAAPIVLVAGVAIYFGLHAARTNGGAAPAASAAATASTTVVATTTTTATTSAVAAPEEVAITIDVKAPGAQVFDGTKLLGTAPGPFKLAKRADKKTLTVKASGFTPKDVPVEPTSDQSISVLLVPIAKTTHAASAPSTVSTDLADPGYH
jgi:hypothetical protein